MSEKNIPFAPDAGTLAWRICNWFAVSRNRGEERTAAELCEQFDCKSALSAYGEVKGGFIELKDVRAAIKKAKADVPVVHIQNPRDGKVVQAVRAADLEAAGLRGKAEPAKKGEQKGESHQQQEAKRAARREQLLQRNLGLLRRVRTARPEKPGLFELKQVAACLLEMVDESDDTSALRELWPAMANRKHADFIEALDLWDLQQLVLDCVLLRNVVPGWYASSDGYPDDLFRAAEHYGVPLEEPGAETPDAAAHAPKKASARGGKKAKAASAAAAEELPADADDAGELEEAAA